MSNLTMEAPADSAITIAPANASQTVVAAYSSHDDAEKAVRLLAENGFSMDKISIIGRNFEIREDVKGYYHPTEAVREGAGFGAIWGGVFGLLAGAGMFILPLQAPVLIMGPLASLAASAIGGVGLGVLAGGLAFLGVDPKNAIRYEEHIQAGQFLVVVHGDPLSQPDRARAILSETKQTLLEAHPSPSDAALS